MDSGIRLKLFLGMLVATTVAASTSCSQSIDFRVLNGLAFRAHWSLTPVTQDTPAHRSAASSSPSNARQEPLEVVVTVNQCPVIDAYIVAPIDRRVGQTIHLSGNAHDPDQRGQLVYQWREGARTVADGAKATFMCTKVGPHHLTFSVRDEGCESTAEVALHCDVASQGEAP
jgi:hypothetical protein